MIVAFYFRVGPTGGPHRDGQPLAVIATQMGSTVGSIATTLSSMRADGAELPRRAATPG